MQLIGAYIIFLLSITALGLGIILCGVIGLALYEVGAWFHAAHPFTRSSSAAKQRKPIVAVTGSIGTF
jgi:hypothetical protein